MPVQGSRITLNSATALAFIATAIVFVLNIRGLFCGFSPMDDHIYVLNNSHIRQLDMNLLRWAFASLPIDLWMPLTWLSLALDYHFWGLNPFGYHLTNNILHAVNSGLVLLIADRVINLIPALKAHLSSPGRLYPLTLLLAGLLFGIHPLRVESVVWITERKDVLNGLFAFTAIFFYLRHAQPRVAASRRLFGRDYLLTCLFFALSLLAKPVSVVLPVIFLAIDRYPLNRWQRGAVRSLLIEKAPFFLLSLTISLLTLYFASQNQILRPYEFLSPWQRLTVSGNAIFEYCRLLLLPIGITPLKLIPTPLPLAYPLKSVAVVLFLLAAFTVWKRQWLSVTLICFLLPLLPVLAIFQNGDQAWAARYTYLPSLAVSIAAAALIGVAGKKLQESGNRLLPGAFALLVAAYLLFLGGMTYHLTRSWDNPEAYWTRVLSVDPAAKPYFERGEYFSKEGRFSEAVADYTRVIEIADGDFRRYVYNVYAFRGEAFRSLGRHDDAVRDFSTAIGMSPHRIYFFSRGQALRALGRVQEAEEDFRIAGEVNGAVDYWYTDLPADEIRSRLEKNPDDADALAARAVTAVRLRDYPAALADFNRAIALSPDRASYYWNRSTLSMETGGVESALADCSMALRLDPRQSDALLRRSALYAAKGKNLLALADLSAVIALRKNSFEGYANRGLLNYRLGKTAEALHDFDAALAINPESAETWYNRGLARSASGDVVAAEDDFKRARELGYR